MRNIIMTSLLLFASLAVKAQDIPYEKLDAISQYISQRQFDANDKSYVENSKTIKVSFIKENFSVLYSNFLATNVVYKMRDGHEIMELAENIDLADVKSINIISENNNFFVYRLAFPPNHIQLQIYEDGKFRESKNASEINLYATGDKWTFYDEMVKLCETLQNKKNKNGYNVTVMSKDWLEAKSKNTVTSYQTFWNKYPSSLYVAVTKTLLEAKKKEIQDEKDRLEKIRLEDIRIQEEKARLEKERLEKIAEAKRVKAERNIGFASIRAGYVIPSNENSKKVSGTPSVMLNSSLTSPYTTGQFGLKSGFNAGLTGIINLEFINKNMPSWIGIGIPVDLNVAMMPYKWEEIKTNSVNNFVFQDAKYNFWGVATVGAGLSISFHPSKKTFIDIIARPDFYGTFGGNYKASATDGSGNYSIKTQRGSGSSGDSFGWAKTAGLNVRYKRILVGFEVKDGIVDKAEFTERIENLGAGTYSIKNAGLNLDYMQFTFGYIL